MPHPLPSVHMLTCPRRVGVVEKTLAHWAGTDWRTTPAVHCDWQSEVRESAWGTAARGTQVARAYAGMMARALQEEGEDRDWLLLLEDDLDFHPQIGTLVASWEALRDERCVLASLFNPSLQDDARWGTMPRAFATHPDTFLSAQAILIRRAAAHRALLIWDDAPGMQAQRLAWLFGGEGPIWVHRPSLVQHVGEDSSWGARVQRAHDFDPVFA